MASSAFSGGRDFGLDENLLARQPLNGPAEPLESAVGLGAIEISDALIVGVMNEPVERLPTQGILHFSAVGAGAEPQPAQLEAGLAQGNLVDRCALGNLAGRQAAALSNSPPAAAAVRWRNWRRLR